MEKRIIEWEKQHASLELCQKLQELGAPTGTCFMWVYNQDLKEWIIFANSVAANALSWDRKAPAYNCAELGEMLPVYIEDKDQFTYEILLSMSDETYVMDMNNENEFVMDSPRQYQICYKKLCAAKALNDYGSEDANEANARAIMLIHLLENGLIKNG